MKRQFLLLLLILCLSLPGLFAQKDISGSSDHPMLSRYPGSYITYFEEVKFREYQYATGPVTAYRYIDKKETIEGQLSRITYYLDKEVDAVSISEVYRDYVQALQKAGIQILAKGSFPQRNVKKDVGGGSWIGLALGANPVPGNSAANKLFAGTSSSGGTFAIMGQIVRPGSKTYVALYGERHSSKLIVCHLDVIEAKAAETGNVFANAEYIKRELDEKGTVSIYGIQFDFDSSTLKAESDNSLKEIAAYLKTHPEVSLFVVGHTDMKGNLTYNLSLSEKRAMAVVDALVAKHGVRRDRLTPDGLAFLAPKASNETEEGRALNRRTELVKRTK